MSHEESIHLKTEREGENRIRMVWSDRNQIFCLPYRIKIPTVQEKADAARAALGHMYNAYLQPRRDFGAALRVVAEKGNELRDALFYDHLPEDALPAEAAHSWFKDITNDPAQVTVTIHADPILQIPWGLLHDITPPYNVEEDIYDSFWARRYKVVTLYNGTQPRNLRAARHFDRLRLISAFNQFVFESTKTLLNSSDQQVVDWFSHRPVGAAFSTAGMRQRWREVGENDCLIHFFGHASGRELRFSESDVLTASQFRRLFRHESGLIARRGAPSYVLTILNGCATGAGHDAESFLEATADPGFCGFIGAEAPVPDNFALLFAQELMHSLILESRSVRETMLHLWTTHKPMALFYGCYAHPDFRIELAPKDPDMFCTFQNRNISYVGLAGN